MSFSIKALEGYAINPETEELDSLLAYGKIQIGDFSERFIMYLGYWDIPKYQSQWLEGVQRILNDEYSTSCLLQNMYDPKQAGFIFTWTMYKIQDTIILHNRMLILDDLEEPFDENNPYNSMDPRETITEEGDPISEWTTSTQELEKFLKVLTSSG